MTTKRDMCKVPFAIPQMTYVIFAKGLDGGMTLYNVAKRDQRAMVAGARIRIDFLIPSEGFLYTFPT